MVTELSEPHTRIEIANFDVNKELKKYNTKFFIVLFKERMKQWEIAKLF